MKITKSRLLQIIREEVELHEKNTFELDENIIKEIEDPNSASTQTPVETDKSGNIKDPKDVLDKAAAGELEEEATEEDLLINPKTKKVINPAKKNDKLEIKIR